MPKLELSQHQELSPFLLQSIRILQMNLTELREYVEQAFCENPMVDLTIPTADSALVNIRSILCFERNPHRSRMVSIDEEPDGLSRIAGDDGTTLYSHLLNQLMLSASQGILTTTAGYIIGCLDERGYLTDDMKDIARELKQPLPLVEKALQWVQTLEPAGVGARDLRECLLLQLDREGNFPIARLIVEQHLEDLAKQRLQNIRNTLGITAEELKQACRKIQSLDPSPGAAFGRPDPVYVIPDIRIEVAGSSVSALVRNDLIPQVRIHPDYLALLENTRDEALRQYLRENLNRTRTLISQVERRQDTLDRCAQAIMHRQEEFFLNTGPLRPMTMGELAGELGLNVSTVSRAVRDKFLQCSRGVYPLSYFFSRGLPATREYDGVSPAHIRSLLERWIREEDRTHPLSDHKLTELLQEEGILVARRTVAKYRSQMGIPPASARRQRKKIIS